MRLVIFFFILFFATTVWSENTLLSTDTIPPCEVLDRSVPPPVPPPPPPPPAPEVEGIFNVVEELPYYPGCEGIEDRKELRDCSNRKMLEFIYEHLEYPPIAKANGVEGTCVIRFSVDEYGRIDKPTIVKDIGAQCGQEALRVVKLLQSEGYGRNRVRVPKKNKTKVYFNLPIKFKWPVKDD